MTTVTVKVEGLQELHAKLLALPNKVERKVVRGALVEGSRVVRDQARSNVTDWPGRVAAGHPEPGTLRKAIVLKYDAERSRGGRFVYIVGVRHGKKYQKMGKKGTNRDAFYWAWVEFGHYTRAAKALPRGNARASKVAAMAKSGAVRWIPGQGFMRRAFESKKGEAVSVVVNSMRNGIAAASKEPA